MLANCIQESILSLSTLTAIFPAGPELASTRMSPFWLLLELRIMEVVVKLEIGDVQSSSQNVTTTNQLLTGRMPFLLPNQQFQSTEGKYGNPVCVLEFRKHLAITKKSLIPLHTS